MRTSALLTSSAVICCCAVLGWQPSQAEAGQARIDRAERKVIRLVNRIRARHGLRRLAVSPRLARAATRHTGDMLRGDFISHQSSDGTSMAARVRRFTDARWVGENIALVPRRSGSTARKVVRMWMRSPGHRSILLSPGSRRIGVGKRIGDVGGWRGAVYTADFASRG